MSTPTSGYLDAINHLPGGATLVFHAVGWKEYTEVLEELEERPHFRVSYDFGRLEVMSPLPEHDYYADFIRALVRAVADELGIAIEGYGSTTWRRESLGKGVEADASFYVANAERITNRIHIDLELDPPPDIVVEIDTTNESFSKFSIYAALSVPEIWHYDGKTMRFFELSDMTYNEIGESRCISGIQPSMLASALERSKQEGQTAALRAFREQIRGIRG